MIRGITSQLFFLLHFVILQNIINTTVVVVDANDTTISTLKKEKSSGSITNFLRDERSFILNLINCFIDDNCHVIYYNTMKTGGTTIEKQLFHNFPFNKEQEEVNNNSCCYNNMMERFNNNKSKYCSAKFTSYIVTSTQLKTIISECNSINDNPDSKTIVLSSFRDPETRTLAYINDMCSKSNPDNKIMQKACNICKYDNVTEHIFDYFTSNTNKVYQYILDIVVTYKNNDDDVNVMTFEMEDIERIFELLSSRYPLFVSLSEGDEKKKKHKNDKDEDDSKICDFGMKSRLIKQLGVSNDIYRKLIADRL